MAIPSSALSLVSFAPPQKSVVLKSLPSQTAIINQSLGSWVQNSPSGSSPALDQPTMNSNNVTLTLTYGYNHVPLGASIFAGFHAVVGFAPQALPSRATYWQQYADESNNFLYLVPPSTLSTGSGVQLLCNVSTLGLANGSTWSYTITGSTYSILVSVFCPIGGAMILVYVTVSYTGATSSATVTVPLQNASGTQTTFGAPMSATGFTGSSAANGLWTLLNTAAPSTPSAGIVYSNAIGISVFSSSSYSYGAQFVFLG